jgi:DNA-directed RNA polymerase specialized sigma24 family protein
MSAPEHAARDRIRRFEADVLVHLEDLYRVALRLTGNAAEAEDLTQDTCLRAFEHGSAARPPPGGSGRSHAIDLPASYRAPGRSASLDIIDSPLLEAGEVLQDTYEALRPSRTHRYEVRQALDRLPLPYREAPGARPRRLLVQGDRRDPSRFRWER